MSADSLRSVTFDKAAVVTGLSTHEYSGNIHPDFSFGPAAHGGFLISLCWQAIARHFSTTLSKTGQVDTISLHVEFLRPASNGPVTITLKDLRLGKGSSTVSFSLQQNGKEAVVGFATNVNFKTYKGINMAIDYAVDYRLNAIDFAKLEANTDPNWVIYHIPYRRSTMNMALSQVRYAMPRHPGPNRDLNEHWISCSNPEERWHTNMLGQIFDHGVPALENYYPDSPHSVTANAAHATQWTTKGFPPLEEHHGWSSPRWYPTASMTIEVKHGLPQEGAKWVFVRMQTKGIVEGRIDLTWEVWDVQGRLVAIAQTLTLVVDVSRGSVSKVMTAGKKGSSKI